MGFYIYLHFDGECADAFEFYQSVFGGEFVRRATYGDAPPEIGISDAEKSRLMHIELHVDDGVMIGADMSEKFGPPPEKGSNFSIFYPAASREKCEEILPKLSEGGQILMPLGDQFWGAYFGMCLDKFGNKWMISHVAG